MITQCSYCRIDTGGNHEMGCPNRTFDTSAIYEMPKPKGIKGYFVAYDKCDFCHEQSPFTMTFPYGSAYDGWAICVECIKKHVEPALMGFLANEGG
jgi:hypothetical protein